MENNTFTFAERKQILDNLKVANRLRVENRQIDHVTCTGYFDSKSLYFVICLEPLPDAPYWHNEVSLTKDQFAKFIDIFKPDFNTASDPSYWDLKDFSGKYVRLCWEVTAPEDMHELANEEDLFAIQHIVNEGDKSIFFV